MVKDYPWYDVVDSKENLLQGDFISECPVLIPTFKISDELEAQISFYNIIVMSQSCDLVEKKLDLVLVCPVWSLSEIEKKYTFYKGKTGKENLRRGNIPAYHLLNKFEIDDYIMDYQVVDFRNLYGVPFDFINNMARNIEKRIRLLPPYREHLSQAFARFFMRVGLPVNIPVFR